MFDTGHEPPSAGSKSCVGFFTSSLSLQHSHLKRREKNFMWTPFNDTRKTNEQKQHAKWLSFTVWWHQMILSHCQESWNYRNALKRDKEHHTHTHTLPSCTSPNEGVILLQSWYWFTHWWQLTSVSVCGSEGAFDLFMPLRMQRWCHVNSGEVRGQRLLIKPSDWLCCVSVIVLLCGGHVGCLNTQD